MGREHEQGNVLCVLQPSRLRGFIYALISSCCLAHSLMKEYELFGYSYSISTHSLICYKEGDNFNILRLFLNNMEIVIIIKCILVF